MYSTNIQPPSIAFCNDARVLVKEFQRGVLIAINQDAIHLLQFFVSQRND
jgi:hypothetical protein